MALSGSAQPMDEKFRQVQDRVGDLLEQLRLLEEILAEADGDGDAPGASGPKEWAFKWLLETLDPKSSVHEQAVTTRTTWKLLKQCVQCLPCWHIVGGLSRFDILKSASSALWALARSESEAATVAERCSEICQALSGLTNAMNASTTNPQLAGVDVPNSTFRPHLETVASILGGFWEILSANHDTMRIKSEDLQQDLKAILHIWETRGPEQEDKTPEAFATHAMTSLLTFAAAKRVELIKDPSFPLVGLLKSHFVMPLQDAYGGGRSAPEAVNLLMAPIKTAAQDSTILDSTKILFSMAEVILLVEEDPLRPRSQDPLRQDLLKAWLDLVEIAIGRGIKKFECGLLAERVICIYKERGCFVSNQSVERILDIFMPAEPHVALRLVGALLSANAPALLAPGDEEAEANMQFILDQCFVVGFTTNKQLSNSTDEMAKDYSQAHGELAHAFLMPLINACGQLRVQSRLLRMYLTALSKVLDAHPNADADALWLIPLFRKRVMEELIPAISWQDISGIVGRISESFVTESKDSVRVASAFGLSAILDGMPSPTTALVSMSDHLKEAAIVQTLRDHSQSRWASWTLLRSIADARTRTESPWGIQMRLASATEGLKALNLAGIDRLVGEALSRFRGNLHSRPLFEDAAASLRCYGRAMTLLVTADAARAWLGSQWGAPLDCLMAVLQDAPAAASLRMFTIIAEFPVLLAAPNALQPWNQVFAILLRRAGNETDMQSEPFNVAECPHEIESPWLSAIDGFVDQVTLNSHQAIAALSHVLQGTMRSASDSVRLASFFTYLSVEPGSIPQDLVESARRLPPIAPGITLKEKAARARVIHYAEFRWRCDAPTTDWLWKMLSVAETMDVVSADEPSCWISFRRELCQFVQRNLREGEITGVLGKTDLNTIGKHIDSIVEEVKSMKKLPEGMLLPLHLRRATLLALRMILQHKSTRKRAEGVQNVVKKRLLNALQNKKLVNDVDSSLCYEIGMTLKSCGVSSQELQPLIKMARTASKNESDKEMVKLRMLAISAKDMPDLDEFSRLLEGEDSTTRQQRDQVAVVIRDVLMSAQSDAVDAQLRTTCTRLSFSKSLGDLRLLMILLRTRPDSNKCIARLSQQLMNGSEISTDRLKLAMSNITMLIKSSPSILGQLPIETLLSALLFLLSPHAKGLPPSSSRQIYTLIAETTHTLLTIPQSRRRLQGRMHLLTPLLTSLLHPLFTSLPHLPQWTSSSHPLSPKEAHRLSRILSAWTDPSGGAVGAQAQKRSGLTDALAAARGYAATYSPAVLGEFAECTMRGRWCAPGVRDALMPGMWAVVGGIARSEGGLEGLSAGLSGSAREVVRNLVAEWRRAGGS